MSANVLEFDELSTLKRRARIAVEHELCIPRPVSAREAAMVNRASGPEMVGVMTYPPGFGSGWREADREALASEIARLRSR